MKSCGENSASRMGILMRKLAKGVFHRFFVGFTSQNKLQQFFCIQFHPTKFSRMVSSTESRYILIQKASTGLLLLHPPLKKTKKEPHKRLRIKHKVSDIAKIKAKNNPQSGTESQSNSHLTNSNLIHPGLRPLPFRLRVSNLTTTSVSFTIQAPKRFLIFRYTRKTYEKR